MKEKRMKKVMIKKIGHSGPLIKLLKVSMQWPKASRKAKENKSGKGAPKG